MLESAGTDCLWKLVITFRTAAG